MIVKAIHFRWLSSALFCSLEMLRCHCSCIVIPLYNIIIQIRPYQQMYGGDGDGLQCHVCSPVYTVVHSGNDNVICGRNAMCCHLNLKCVMQITPCDSHIHIHFTVFFQFIKTVMFYIYILNVKRLKWSFSSKTGRRWPKCSSVYPVLLFWTLTL